MSAQPSAPGDLDFRNIHRTFALGAASRTETGDTNGTNVMARVLGGYWFNTTVNWLHGPFARLTYQQNKVYAWSEEGTSSTAMSFGHQQRESLVSSLGWQASGSFGSLRPFARVTWEKEYDNGERTVRAGTRIDRRHRLRPAGASSRRQLRAVRGRRERRSGQQAHRLRQRQCDGLQGRRQLPGGDGGRAAAPLSVARARKGRVMRPFFLTSRHAPAHLREVLQSCDGAGAVPRSHFSVDQGDRHRLAAAGEHQRQRACVFLR